MWFTKKKLGSGRYIVTINYQDMEIDWHIGTEEECETFLEGYFNP